MMTLPAPVGGWNAISALAEMPITDAIVMDNLIPYATEVRSRDGYVEHTSSALTNAHTLVSYNASTPKLLLGANGNIYDITSGTATDKTSTLTAFANNKWITNGYKNRLIFTNGADVPLEYDGTNISQLTLTDVDTTSYTTTNVVSNHDFQTGDLTGWTVVGAFAAVDAGSGNYVARKTAGSVATMTQSSIMLVGKRYKITYTVSNRTAGTVTVYAGTTAGAAQSTNDTFTEYLTCASNGNLNFLGDAAFDGDIDEVIVYVESLIPEYLQGSVTFKGRVYYWEKPSGNNPQTFWYASAGAYTGALTKFNLSEFTEGGYIVACFNWTHDGGQGLDDNFVVLMSTGQVLVYAGSDPGDALDWALIGIYDIGEPIGLRPVTQLGGDALVLTKDGYLILSAAIQDGRYSENSSYSFKISPSAAQAAKDYESNFGWEGVLYTAGSLFIVNVPIATNYSIQHVRNTTTGAWCRFTGMNACTWCVHDGGLYFAGTDGIVYRYRGSSDNSGFIPMRCTQAYTYLGDPSSKKLITAIEVMSNYAYPKYLHSDWFVDFNEKTLPAITDPPEPASSEWDVAEWDVSEWGASTLGTNTARRNASAFGYAISHTLRLRSRSQRFVWYASHIYAKGAGVV